MSSAPDPRPLPQSHFEIKGWPMPGLEKRTALRGRVEIALRVEDLNAMQTFTRKWSFAVDEQKSALGVLQNRGWVWRSHTGARIVRFPTSSRYRRSAVATSTLDHIAFEIDPADLAGEKID